MTSRLTDATDSIQRPTPAQPPHGTAAGRRGSVLVLVVALLVLLALVATAFLTTTRLDRAASVQHVINTQKEFIFEAGQVYLQGEILNDILDPTALQNTDPAIANATTVRNPGTIAAPSAYKPIDSPLTDPFLGVREPFLQITHSLQSGNNVRIPRPMWRTVSWPTFTNVELAQGLRYEPPDNNQLVRPTPLVANVSPDIGPIDLVRRYENGVAYKTGEVVMVPAQVAGSFDYYVRTIISAGSNSTIATQPGGGLPVFPLTPGGAWWEKCDPKQYFSFAPTTVVGKDGKSYPAFYVYNNYVAARWRSGAWNANNDARYVTGPVLAADADGDGIADSIYRKLPVGELAGITYYMAVRVIDNNSAININTAWASTGFEYASGSDGDFGFDYSQPNSNLARIGTFPNFGIFRGNVGLRDMMISADQARVMGAPSIYVGENDNIGDLSESRRIYYPVPSFSSQGDDPALREMSWINIYRFGFNLNTATIALSLGTRPSQDRLIGANWTFESRPDFRFRTQTEALDALSASRPRYLAIGDNNGAGGNPNDVIAAGGPAADRKLRWFDLASDGAALAYRGGVLVNTDVSPGTIDQLFLEAGRTGTYGGGANSLDSIFNSAGNRNRGPQGTTINPAFGLKSYPVGATAAATGVNTSVDAWFDINFNFDRYYGFGRFVVDPPNAPFAFFRSIRPLLVTSNGVSSVIGPRTEAQGRVDVPAQVADYRSDLAAGSINNNAYSIITGFGDPAGVNTHQFFDGDYYTINVVGNETAQLGPAVGTFSAMATYKESFITGGTGTNSAMTATTSKISANTAPFGELWRGFWSVMAEDWAETVGTTGTTSLINSGTSFERAIRAAEASLGGTIYNPYHGSRFDSGVLGLDNDFRPTSTARGLDQDGTIVAYTQVPYVAPAVDSGLAIPVQHEQHPARMFRSPIRSFVLDEAGTGNSTDFVPPLTTTPPTTNFQANASLPRLRPDQMILLRSAIAAVNAEDMRDTDFRVTRRTILLEASGQIPQPTTDGTLPDGGQVAVTINGFEPQPFITEVFAHTDTTTERGTGAANANTGYIAIELHNPYPFPIDIRNCKIGLINRWDSKQPGYPAMRVMDSETTDPSGGGLFIVLSNASSNLDDPSHFPPTVVPANGYLVLENYDAGGTAAATNAAQSRPNSAGLNALTGSADGAGAIEIGTAGRRANFAFVANLHRVLNREFVLMRPIDVELDPEPEAGDPANFLNEQTNGFLRREMSAVTNAGFNAGTAEATSVRTLVYADPIIHPSGATRAARAERTAAVDMVPLDSFDFTGLTLSTEPAAIDTLPAFARTNGVANAWHYVRGNESLSSTIPNDIGTGAWRFVYPGRYDGTKFVARAAGPSPLGRQQGTIDAGTWVDADPTSSTVAPWDELGTEGPTVGPGIRLGRSDAVASYRYAFNLGQFERGEFPIPLAAGGFAPAGIRPADPANYGLGYFYPAVPTNSVPSNPLEIRQSTQPAHAPFGGFGRNGDLLAVPFIGSYRIQVARNIGNNGTIGGVPIRELVLEMNAITMDAAMAEDTDVNDDPIVGPATNQITPDIGEQGREQIGRFMPLRKTWLPVTAIAASGNDPFANNAEPFDYAGNVAWLAGNGNFPVLYDDLVPDILNGDVSAGAYGFTNLNRYRWASDLFDFFTVRSAADDYLPNVKPATGKENFLADARAVRNTETAEPNTSVEVNQPIEGLVNINSASERVLAMLPWVPDGKNIVAATFTVVPQDWLTFVDNGSGAVLTEANGVPDNLEMARAIVRFRDGFNARNVTYLGYPSSDYFDAVSAAGSFRSQPFLSMWDLYRVPEFRNVQSILLDPTFGNGNPTFTLRRFLDDRFGDISPFPHDFNEFDFREKAFAPGDRVILNGVRFECTVAHKSDNTNAPPNNQFWRQETDGTTRGFSRAMFDYEEQSLLLTRVSNLITTRSDVFTAYLLLEGWQNAGTPQAELKVSRRQAFFLDRSQTTPGTIELKAPVPIPVD